MADWQDKLKEENAVTPKVLLSPRHSFFHKVTHKTRVRGVGPEVRSVSHQCREDVAPAFMAGERPVHNTRRADYCHKCDTLYVFEELPPWALLLGRGGQGGTKTAASAEQG